MVAESQGITLRVRGLRGEPLGHDRRSRGTGAGAISMVAESEADGRRLLSKRMGGMAVGSQVLT